MIKYLLRLSLINYDEAMQIAPAAGSQVRAAQLACREVGDKHLGHLWNVNHLLQRFKQIYE